MSCQHRATRTNSYERTEENLSMRDRPRETVGELDDTVDGPDTRSASWQYIGAAPDAYRM